MSNKEVTRTYLVPGYVAERLVDAQVYVQSKLNGNGSERVIGPEADLRTAVRKVRIEFQTMQEAGQAWWRQTTAHSLSEPESPEDRIRETVQFAAARYVQIAVPADKAVATTRSLYAEIARVFPAKPVEESSIIVEAEAASAPDGQAEEQQIAVVPSDAAPAPRAL